MHRFVYRRAALCVLGAAVFSFVVCRNVSASSAVVTPPGTTLCKSFATYPTIALGLSSVPAGSTIYIGPGTYAKQVVITMKLTLEGVAQNGDVGAEAVG